MVTITNKLETCLVIPGGLGEKGSLTFAPKTRVKVEKITAPIKDAEKRGLVKIAYPTEKPAPSKAEGKTGKGAPKA